MHESVIEKKYSRCVSEFISLFMEVIMEFYNIVKACVCGCVLCSICGDIRGMEDTKISISEVRNRLASNCSTLVLSSHLSNHKLEEIVLNVDRCRAIVANTSRPDWEMFLSPIGLLLSKHCRDVAVCCKESSYMRSSMDSILPVVKDIMANHEDEVSEEILKKLYAIVPLNSSSMFAHEKDFISVGNQLLQLIQS